MFRFLATDTKSNESQWIAAKNWVEALGKMHDKGLPSSYALVFIDGVKEKLRLGI